MLPSITVSDSGGSTDDEVDAKEDDMDDDDDESMIELEWPGDAKKKRWEA